MMHAKNIFKSFSSNVVLEGIDLVIKEGKITTLVGENGSGKSTLLKILSGSILPDKGVVEYKDASVSDINFPYKHDICFIHEGIDLILPMNTHDYISRLKGRIPNWNDDFFYQMVLDRKIDLKKYFHEYSRGQKMQIMLMIALASAPKVLLIDEITSVIDTYGRKYYLDLIYKHVKKGNSAVFTTNIINELEFYTDQVVILKNKRKVFDQEIGGVSEFFVKIRITDHDVINFTNDREAVWAGVNSDRSTSYIVSQDFLAKHDISEELIDKRKSTLEDLFIYFFTKNHSTRESDEAAA
jgi:ABC-2 type transport system ATP-binding protein